MSWIFAPNISVKHGFSTRHGGVSGQPFGSLNLGGHEDSLENINHNRNIALNILGIEPLNVAYLKQVHGSDVIVAEKGIQTGDGLVSDQKGISLAISVADCYPLIFHDSVNHIIGAAHAGWRGTVARIASKTIEEMKKLGADPVQIKVAIGQGICLQNFEVGDEVIQQFRDAGFNENCFSGRNIDLISANKQILLESGILEENIWSMNRCTFEPDFFSYRRDKGKTGRMWAVITL